MDYDNGKDGYSLRFSWATFENGDKCTGAWRYEDGERWFIAVDKDGNEYETREMPCERIDITNAEHWTVIAKPAHTRLESDLISPLLRKQQKNEKAQATLSFDAFDLPLFGGR